MLYLQRQLITASLNSLIVTMFFSFYFCRKPKFSLNPSGAFVHWFNNHALHSHSK